MVETVIREVGKMNNEGFEGQMSLEGIPIIEKESGESAFKRVSERRVNNVIESIRILTNMASNSKYKYTKKEIDTMFASIEEAVKQSKMAFTHQFERFEWDRKK